MDFWPSSFSGFTWTRKGTPKIPLALCGWKDLSEADPLDSRPFPNPAQGDVVVVDSENQNLIWAF